MNTISTTRINWEFYIVTRGQCAPVFDEVEHPVLSRKTLWVLPPGLVCGWTGNRTGWDHLALHFGCIPDVLKSRFAERRYLKVSLNDEDIDSVKSIFRSVDSEIYRSSGLSDLVFHRALIDLTFVALKTEPTKKTVGLEDVAYQRVANAIGWYSEHMHECPGVDEVAAKTNISSCHLRRHFHLVKNCSPNSYFLRFRMERACRLLIETTDTLEQIASTCGFSSASEFCRLFRKSFKTTPHNWRMRSNLRERASGCNEAFSFNNLFCLPEQLVKKNRAYAQQNRSSLKKYNPFIEEMA